MIMLLQFLFVLCFCFYLFPDSESTEPLSVDGISDLEGEEGEEDVGTSIPEGEIPQIPDQEKFLKQHFGTLGSTDGKGTALCLLGELSLRGISAGYKCIKRRKYGISVEMLED